MAVKPDQVPSLQAQFPSVQLQTTLYHPHLFTVVIHVQVRSNLEQKIFYTQYISIIMVQCTKLLLWATTKYLLSRLDAFDTWALRKILRIPYTHMCQFMRKSEEPLVVHRFLTWASMHDAVLS